MCADGRRELEDTEGRKKLKKEQTMKNNDMIREYYNRKPEIDRLETGGGRLEFLRTKEIIGRYLPSAPCRVLEVGGGAGHYSFWLAELGHKVTLVDLADAHVDLALEKNAAAAEKLERVERGDARDLRFGDASFDLVLNLGPMYHLLEKDDRLTALRQARRVARPGGVVFSAYISRFASLIDGYRRRFVLDPAYRKILEGDLSDGRHEPGSDEYFTHAYFPRINEILPELEAAGFRNSELLAVEGFFWILPDMDSYLSDEAERERLLAYARQTEKEESMLGASAHLLAFSRA
jgi:SAM-dependent methyltransferase